MKGSLSKSSYLKNIAVPAPRDKPWRKKGLKRVLGWVISIYDAILFTRRLGILCRAKHWTWDSGGLVRVVGEDGAQVHVR